MKTPCPFDKKIYCNQELNDCEFCPSYMTEIGFNPERVSKKKLLVYGFYALCAIVIFCLVLVVFFNAVKN